MSDNELEKDRQELLDKAKENFDGEEELKRRFGDGTYGAHELMDRAYMVMETWETYVKEHPTTVLNPDLFKLANEAWQKMFDFYQLAGRHSLEADPKCGIMGAHGEPGVKADRNTND